MPSPFRRTVGRRENGAVRLVSMISLLFLLSGGAAGGAVIRDLTDLSQDPSSYLDRSADTPLLPAPEQARLSDEYLLQYFAPWHRTEPRHTPELASWGFRKYAGNPGYGKGGRPHPPDWVRKMAANARVEDYPQGMFPGVTAKRTDFRMLPTHEPHSSYPPGPGKEHPFDNLQESSAPAGMPVLVTLASRDRKWLLVETNHLIGWVPATDIAAVDPEFMQRWENGRYVTVVRDKTPVREGERVLFTAPLGALFPKTGEDAEQTWIWTAARDARGKALLRKGSIAKEAAADKPLPFTPRHVARLAREMAGEPYGWGGLDGKRDCSALTRDLFAPFGLWLPRNSGEQAQAGKFTSFANLSPAEKEARIVRDGVPWRTLLWTPGHIMLYIGVHQGKPLIFHNFWSVKTRNADGKREKLIVGRAAVTTLNPGRELQRPDLPPTNYGLEGMVFLGEPPDAAVNPETKP